jgi:hypothetical protein
MKPKASETNRDTDIAAFKLEEDVTQPTRHPTPRARREEPETKFEFAIRAPAPSRSKSAAPLPERRTPKAPPRTDSSEAETSPAAAVLPSIDDADLTRAPPRSSPLKAPAAEAGPAAAVLPSIDDASLTRAPPQSPPVKTPAASAASAQRRPGVSEEPRTQAISPELLKLASSLCPAVPKAPAGPAPEPAAQSRPAPKPTLPAPSSIMTELVPLQLTVPARARTDAGHRAATPRSSMPKTRTAPSLRKRRAAALLGGCTTALVLGALWLSRSQLQAALTPPDAPNPPAPALQDERPAALAAEQAQPRAWPQGPVELEAEPDQAETKRQPASPERPAQHTAEPAQPRAALAGVVPDEPPRAAGRRTLAGDAPASDAPAGDAPAGDAPAGNAPADDSPASKLVALEKQAVDRLIANEYEAARALYTRLQAATPGRTEYAVMTKLLERRLRADCGAEHPCP